ncbi:MAG: dTMP kinase [Phycisphaerae bacterium]|jgi:dTMP kinase|nr:dTMP kinase [Phycisphaerae bacterium]MBT5584508.1 dTMP kinase [Phycisphaerae bacterium]MBT5657017.1 dTMP kinase [Phycisphaerae bacterium]MBT7351591.1 dTMP kinase [Phycisphaerae bacterium]
MQLAIDPEASRADTSYMHQLLRGKFIAFEGPDGSGKSTQMARLAKFARSHGLTVVEVREPGGTSVGEQIRGVLLDPANTDMTVLCEMMLYMASRSQLVEQIVAPALDRGDLVLADRFVASTCAYQGTAGGLVMREILEVAAVATGHRMPDLNVIFDVDEATAAKRLNPLLDRMEQKGAEFHRRVRDGYQKLASEDPRHFILIDATLDEDTVYEAAMKAIEVSLSDTHPPATVHQ